MVKDDWDSELVKDFFLEFKEAQQVVMATLLNAENEPENSNHINKVFRSIHSIKSLLRMIGLHDISSLVHTLENVLDLIRKNEMAFSKHISELILAVMEVVEKNAEHSFNQQPLVFDLKIIAKELQAVADCGPAQRIQQIENFLSLIDPEQKSSIVIKEVLKDSHVLVDDQSEFDIKSFEAGLPSLADFTPQQRDLAFFRKLNRTLERRGLYREGRAELINIICIELNAYLQQPINPEQLMAAIYTHDIGMASLPQEILGGHPPKTEEHKIVLFEHPMVAKNLLDSFSGWEEASKIAYQHQECFNGSGYPLGLKGTDIHLGARMLAICDFFEMKTHFNLPPAVPLKRVMLNTIIEINNLAGSLFDKEIVTIFNKVIQQLYKDRKILDNDEWHQ